MSADNWRVCPKCKGGFKPKPEAVYGKATEKEYVDSLAVRPEYAPETFREDFEIGMEPEGVFYVSYFGRCQACGFSHQFEHTEQVPLRP